MNKKLTQEETKARDERVAKVEAEIAVEAEVRLSTGLKETKEEKEMREESETKRIEAAKVAAPSKEDQLHVSARDARILAVKNAIDAAKVKRDLAEAEGVIETPGAKIDREDKEAKDLKEASVLNVIETVGIDHNSAEVKKLAEKVNEIIDYLNG